DEAGTVFSQSHLASAASLESSIARSEKRQSRELRQVKVQSGSRSSPKLELYSVFLIQEALMQWWLGFVDGEETPVTIDKGELGDLALIRFERARDRQVHGKVFDRMCIWDDEVVRGGGAVACHNISPWEVYALARARMIPPPEVIEMRSREDTNRHL